MADDKRYVTSTRHSVCRPFCLFRNLPPHDILKCEFGINNNILMAIVQGSHGQRSGYLIGVLRCSMTHTDRNRTQERGAEAPFFAPQFHAFLRRSGTTCRKTKLLSQLVKVSRTTLFLGLGPRAVPFMISPTNMVVMRYSPRSRALIAISATS